MRKLFLLRGAAGCGKSKLINDLGLQNLTLSFDVFRDLFGTTAHAFDGETVSIRRHTDVVAIQACYNAAEARMHNGQAIFIDNTNLKAKDVRAWKAIADRNGYETIVVNVQGEITLDELLERNQSRTERKQLGADRAAKVERMFKSYHSQAPLPGIRYITPAEVEEELVVRVFDASDYEEVIVVGDIQGCGNALEALTNKVGSLDDENRLWVFCGDLFDRGDSPAKVMSLLLSDRSNVVLVEGNHERSVRETLLGLREYRASKVTIDDVSSSYSPRQLLELVNRGIPFFPFEFAGKKRWVTHAGIMPFILEGLYNSETNSYKSGYLSNHEFFTGTGIRTKTYQNQGTYQDFSDKLEEGTEESGIVDVQYFGHRNDSPGKDPLSWESIRLLEHEVEAGGELTAVVISSNGTETVVTVPGSTQN